MNEKITGHVLLWVGILIMVISVANIFMVFTGKAKPISAVKLSTQTTGTSQTGMDLTKLFPNMSLERQNELSQLGPINPMAGLFDGESFNDIINLTTHFFLMSFLLGFGHKLASLGSNMLRPVNVTVTSRKISDSPAVQDYMKTSP